MADAEAAAEIRDARLPAERIAGRGGERREALDRLRLGGEVRQLRADVHVEAEHVEPTLERVGDRLQSLLRGQAELRPVVPGDDRLVGVRVDSEGDADERLANAGDGGERGFVRRVEDHCRAYGGRGAEERLVLVVAVDE